MKKIYSLLIIACACVMSASAEKEVYGVYNGEVLTLQYDENREANNGATEWWGGVYHVERSAVKTIVIDASVSDARPDRTRNWFGGYENLEQIIGMEFLNTSNTTDMQDMFSESSKLETVDLSHMDTRYVRSMGGMFMGCAALKELNLYSFNISSLEDTEAMFANCTSLEKIYCPLNWEQSDKLTNSDVMFYGCEKLKGGQGTRYDADYTEKNYARPDKGTALPGYFWTTDDTGEPEGIERAQNTEHRAQKIILDGQLLIERNGKIFNATGAEMK